MYTLLPLCWWNVSNGVLILYADSSFVVTRVSSAQIKSTLVSVSKARDEMSLRLPIGVATRNSVAMGSGVLGTRTLHACHIIKDFNENRRYRNTQQHTCDSGKLATDEKGNDDDDRIQAH